MSKIAIVSAMPPSQATLNEYGYHLARALQDTHGKDNIIIFGDTITDDDDSKEMLPGVKRVWTFNNPFTPLRILAAAIRYKPELVIINCHMASFGKNELSSGIGLSTAAILKLFGFKTGIVLHNILDSIELEKSTIKSSFRRTIIRAGSRVINRLILKSDYVTVTLNEYKEKLRKYGSTDHVFHVPHGRFDGLTNSLQQLVERPQNVIAFGKFGTYKKLDNLIQAMEILSQDPKFQDINLIIGGTNHHNSPGYIEKILNDYAHLNNISYIGYVPENDVPAFFNKGVCCVFDYSTTTGSSGVLSQATSHGVVPVFPLINDFKTIEAEENIQGLHFTPDNPVSLVAQLRLLFTNKEEFQQIVDQNYAEKVEKSPHINDIAAWHIARLQQSDQLGTEPKDSKPKRKQYVS